MIKQMTYRMSELDRFREVCRAYQELPSCSSACAVSGIASDECLGDVIKFRNANLCLIHHLGGATNIHNFSRETALLLLSMIQQFRDDTLCRIERGDFDEPDDFTKTYVTGGK